MWLNLKHAYGKKGCLILELKADLIFDLHSNKKVQLKYVDFVSPTWNNHQQVKANISLKHFFQFLLKKTQVAAFIVSLYLAFAAKKIVNSALWIDVTKDRAGYFSRQCTKSNGSLSATSWDANASCISLTGLRAPDVWQF